jgi:serine/threonine protein phosphatase PrpC
MEVGSLSRPKYGESICGDSFLVTEKEGIMTIALVDGLGHGKMASDAAQAAIECVRDNNRLSISEIISNCHIKLKKTRGAVMGIARIDTNQGTLEFAGVGNIELRAISKSNIRPICTSGIVGYNVRKVIKFEYKMDPGDIIVMFSDGISSRLDLNSYSGYDPQSMAERIVESHGNGNDDATVVVVRYEEYT